MFYISVRKEAILNLKERFVIGGGGEVSKCYDAEPFFHHLRSDVCVLCGRFNVTGYFVLGVI